jgi:enamine deaminase RidA (YjgF/YER057c/UK114 family)
MASTDAVLAVHGEVFGSIRPAATLIGVAGLIESTVKIEIEAEARRGA